MFNDKAYPYVKSMNKTLRKTHLEDFADFNNKTIELNASSNYFEKEGLFCLVDFMETNEVYIFKIIEFTEDKITLDSFLKISKEIWLGFDCKERITKPGVMRSNSLKFISGIKSIVLPNCNESENNRLGNRMLKSKLKFKSNIINSLKEENKLLEKQFKDELDLTKEYYESKIKSIEDENETQLNTTCQEYDTKISELNELYESKLENRILQVENRIENTKQKILNFKLDCEEQLSLNHNKYDNKVIEFNNKVIEYEELELSFANYKENTEQKILSLKKDYEEKEKQTYILAKNNNFNETIGDFITIMIFMAPLIISNVFN